MTDTSSMLFSFESMDPEDFSWQLSLGKTALDKVGDPDYAGMTAVEACLTRICLQHKSDSGVPTSDEEKCLRLLVEDALGDTSFQREILPTLIKTAIEFENSAVVAILIPYAEDQSSVLRRANSDETDEKVAPQKSPAEVLAAAQQPDSEAEARKSEAEAFKQAIDATCPFSALQ